jgi:hypothetical protein
MPALPIRYSPSGPIIGNDDGGEATPGPGFTLRIADRQNTAGALVFSGVAQAIPATGPSDFITSLTNPKPGLRYGAELLVCVQNTGGAVATVAIGAQYRIDAGAWVDEPRVMRYSQVLAADATMPLKFQTLFTLGQDLAAPVLDGSLLIDVQFTALVTVGAASLANCTLAARLYETL